MRRSLVIWTMFAALGTISTGFHGTLGKLQAAATIPAWASFGDASGDGIRSDGAGTYYDGVGCVKSGVSGNQYFFRSATYGCSPATRTVTLDFTQAVGTCVDPTYETDAYAGGSLNICGPNAVPDVRVVATSMFASTALTKGTPVTLIFSTPANYSGPGGFELHFEQNVAVSWYSPTTRMLNASASAIAELYQNVPNGRKASQKVSLGRYYMPFSLTVQKLQ